MLGLGFDIHRLVKGRKLILGGIQINSDRGLLGHSDADVVLHALIDAILGAVKLRRAGDIGDLFPNSSQKYKNISSVILLKQAIAFVKRYKPDFKISGIDCIVFLEEPKLGQKKVDILKKIAQLCGIPADKVSVKAKTMEGLGVIGHKKAAAAIIMIEVFGRGKSHI